jgi:hypothetical protein
MSNETPRNSLPPLTSYATVIHDNFTEMMKHMTPISAAAEAVHKGFDVLLGEASAVNSGLMITPAVMALAAHHSWIEGFVLTGAGHGETGLAAARRGMEFCFYAAKTAESEKRVKDWWNLEDDPKAAGRFRGQTHIPCTYSREKYRFLWPLIVLYDLASEAGVHANPASIAPRLIMEEAIFTLRHQMDREETISRAVHMAVIGHQLYRAFSRILGPCVRNGDLQRQMMSFADEREKELRLGYARHTFKGRVPAKVIIDILTGNRSAMEARFKELVRNCPCKARSQAKPSTDPAGGADSPPVGD